MLEGNISYSIYLVDDSKHIACNGVVHSPGGYALRLVNQATLDADNILLIGETNEQNGIALETKSVFKGEHLSIWNLPIVIGEAKARLYHSVIGGEKSAVSILENADWTADENWWDVAEIKWRNTVYPREKFAGYTRDSGQDMKSRRENLTRENVLQGETAPLGIARESLPKP